MANASILLLSRRGTNEVADEGPHGCGRRFSWEVMVDNCEVPQCPYEAAPGSAYCVTHHLFNEECNMVDAVSGDDVVGRVCSVCGAEADCDDD